MSAGEPVFIGRELQAEAVRLGIKQNAIAERLGWTKHKLSRVLSGDVPLPPNFVQEFRDALNAEIIASALEIQAEAEAYRAKQLDIADRLLKRAAAQDLAGAR